MAKRWQMLLGALTIGALPLCLPAQAPAPPSGQERAEAPPPAQRAEPAPAAPPAPRSPSEDDGFVPTEELAADEEVTFPIDI